jgi:hypothetical protein
LWQPGYVTRRWWPLPLLIVLVIGAGAAVGYGLRELAAQTSGDQDRAPAAPALTTTALPEAVPGPSEVELAADVKSDPASADIQKLLQQHFNAINKRDYEAWQKTVTRQRSAGSPKQGWREDYGSTTDGSILVHRIEPTTTGSVVLISFISIQNPTLAPDRQSGCLRWRVGYLVIRDRGELRLGLSDPTASQYSPC